MYTKDDIIKGMEMPKRGSDGRPPSTGRPRTAAPDSKYPVETLSVGDSVNFGPFTEALRLRILRGFHKQASRWLPGAKFASRNIKGKLTVWRIQ